MSEARYIMFAIAFLCLVNLNLVALEGNCTNAHQEFRECGSACPNTCNSMYRRDIACAAVCVPGCYCESGYVYNRNGKCVLPADCTDEDLNCPEGSFINRCSSGIIKSCYYDPGIAEAKEKLCKPTCECSGDLVFNDLTHTCTDAKFCYISEENKACREKNFYLKYSCNGKKCGCICSESTVYNKITGECVDHDEL